MQTAAALSLTGELGLLVSADQTGLARVQESRTRTSSCPPALSSWFMAADETWPGGQPRQEDAAQ